MASALRNSLALAMLSMLGCGTNIESPSQGTASSGTTGAGGSSASTSGATSTTGGFTGMDAGFPEIDAGLDDMGCADRADTCPVPEDPSSPDYVQSHLGTLLETCGVCGTVAVTFDGGGCAIALSGGGGGDWENAIACVAEHLNTERWPCAAGKSVEAYQSCTVK